ncbi:hypothetical protein V495_00106 [Pseudogymnoascus sp. VKM F-4514 (FW-929)]|nr:hypothetical protein V495_00106 [Pseudogymnoascus sp. VKM F-4514 (FW-929)]KFY67653.1 hypothetical protein V497_00275 [Pseudogymnoascus sp. VKM F-4516 (FW-969)]
MLGENGEEQFVHTNIAIWILTSASAVFLFVRLYCCASQKYGGTTSFSRPHGYVTSRLEAHVYGTAFVNLPEKLILLVASALLSSATTVGYDTDDDKRAFFRFHHISAQVRRAILL